MAIQIYEDQLYTTTCVSNMFIDRLMPEANGEFVKVYLYLLRSVSRHRNSCTISGIADDLNHTEADVMRALRYWERMNVLNLDVEGNEICGIHLIDLAGETERDRDIPPSRPAPGTVSGNPPLTESREQTAHTVATANLIVTKGKDAPLRKEYTKDEICRFMDDDSVSELFFIIETYLKHPLNSTDTNTILYWLDTLHFPADLVIYLVEYCISKGHSSLRYMDKVAMAWNEQQITSVEQAKEHAAAHSQTYYGVMKAFGISGRNLVDVETAFINKWTKDFSFDLPIVLEACRRTMSATHQPSFEYADSILTSWHNKRVHTMEDIQVLDREHNSATKTQRSLPAKDTVKRTKFSNFEQRQYDYDKLEEMLLTTSIQ